MIAEEAGSGERGGRHGEHRNRRSAGHDQRPRGGAGRPRRTHRACSRSCSCTGSGCCPRAGTAGRPCSRRRATRRSRRAGRTTPRRWTRRRRIRRCSRARASATSPTTAGGIIERLDKKPAVIGHSFGGLLTQILAGRGLSAASVAIDPAPFRGVLPLPISALRSAAPVLRQPGEPSPRRSAHVRAVPLRLRERRRRGRGEGAVRDVCRRRVRASRSSRPRPRTSTRGRRRRSTRRTPSAGRC